MKGCAYIGSKDVGSFFHLLMKKYMTLLKQDIVKKSYLYDCCMQPFIRYNTIVVYATVS